MRPAAGASSFDLIAVAGAPGTGTTTLCKLLAVTLGWPHVYAGAIFRELAKERGMTLAEFSAYAEAHPEVDSELDRRMIEVARGGRVVLEGRMAAWQVREADANALTVLLEAPLEVRAARVARRESVEDSALVVREIREREASESKRYISFYGFDPTVRDAYAYVLETHDKTPEEVRDHVLARFNG